MISLLRKLLGKLRTQNTVKLFAQSAKKAKQPDNYIFPWHHDNE